ncbi:serine protease [Streptomyces sp. NPDC088194]|uniref:serine protease n=1 Tax=Streptomyces sp. NPDC088194 TaxID=3154931 RepID=UPI00344F764E
MEAEGGIGGRSSWAAPSWAVRIRRGDGTIAGAGVLVDPEWVLTHAGAVAEGERVTAELVGAGGVSLHAVADQVCAAEAGGVALLRLDGSGPAGAAGSLRRLSVPHRRVRMYGFPAADGTGRWMAAATEAVASGTDGRVRLAPAGPGAAGFGGAGVTDAATGDIVGVALPGNVNGDRAGPYLSPAETVVRHLPRARGWTRGWAAVDERLDVLGRERGMFDPHFAQRLAEWFRGDRPRSVPRPPGAPHAPGVPVRPGPARTRRRTGDGSQVKISQVRADHPVRVTTLCRALRLADRELPGPAAGDAETDPPPGGLDLALSASGRSTLWIAERVADRLGVLPEGREDIDDTGIDAIVRRILAASTTLTLVLVGVDEAPDPDGLLDLLARLRVHGDRMLLVFRRDGAHVARAESQLVIEPSQQRQARLVGMLTEITGPLADALHERMAEVRADCDRALDALVKAHAVRTTMAGTVGVAAGRGGHPDLARFERVAVRAERRIREAVERLDPLIERRAELIGRLDSYQVLHQTALDSEDLAAEDRYQAAYELLHARPCDLAAAEVAMREYAGFIERWSSRHPQRRGPSGPGADGQPGSGDGAGEGAEVHHVASPNRRAEPNHEVEPNHGAGPNHGAAPNHGAGPYRAAGPRHASERGQVPLREPDQEGGEPRP